MEEEKGLLGETLDTVNQLFSENAELRTELNTLKNFDFELRKACGLHATDTPEEIKRKVNIINYLRLGGLATHGLDLDWNRRESMQAIPFLIENLSVSDLEQFVELMSTVVASVAAYVKGSPTIKLRRQEKQQAEKEAAKRKAEEMALRTPRAKAEKREIAADSKAELKAIKGLMKANLTEEQAREFIKKMKGV
jgi:hypothetical protein